MPSLGPRRKHCPQSDNDRCEPGFIAVEWIAAMVLLLLPVIFIGAGISRWPERQQAARAAASEAARAAVLAPDESTARANAVLVGREVAANYAIPPDQIVIEVDIASWVWGAEVTVKVTTAMPSLDVPGVGSWSATDWSVEVSQRIEDHRELR